MKRIVSVWLPSWPITRLRRANPLSVPSFDPFVLVESGAHGLRISAVNASAQRAGIEPGISLADARAAFPGLVSRSAEPKKDHAELLRLARWAGRYGPNRHYDGDDALWIDITGVAHLFGGEDWLLDDLTERLTAFGIPAQAAVADTHGAAHALARYGCPENATWVQAPVGLTRQAIAPLPVEGLRLDAESVLLLKRLGLRRIGQLYEIPRNSLARRFRSTNIARDVLQRLDLALGTTAEPLRPLESPPVLSVQRSFAEPLISSEALETCTAELVQELCEALAQQGLGARSVRLAFYRADGTVGSLKASMSRPSREASHLLALIKEKLAAIDAGFGVDLLRLEALSVARRGASQSGFAEPGASYATGPMKIVDRLCNRFGTGAITVLRPRGSHVPERAEALVPALHAIAETSSGATNICWNGIEGMQRPACILSRPETIEVIADVPDGPPARFVWRRVERHVVRAEGPERIEPEWWNAIHLEEGSNRPRPRDYYRIEDRAGSAFWVFRHGLYGSEEDSAPPSWFLHGLFA